MTTRNLSYLLEPRSVAVIGASNREHSVGAKVFANVIAGGFRGAVFAVNPRHPRIDGHRSYPNVASLPEVPDLAIICTRASTVPGLIAELGEKGTRAAVVLSAGLEAPGPDGRSLTAAMLAAAKPKLLRILGPNCVGMLLPHIGLNASFAHTDALPGDLAFVTQSGALTTAMLDWARGMQIGFSHFISLGNGADVDFGDLLDYLTADPKTRAILLYAESVTSARKFMSAARAASRNKPVIIVKAGRVPEGAQAATSHTGALAGADDVYDAAIRRAGMLRVRTTRQLFDAAETLARMKPLRGERLAIVSNGGGPAVLAVDALVEGGGVLATLSDETINRLNALLPANWSRGNPIDIIGDAPQERYAAALDVVLADPGVDAALLVHAPTAIVDPLLIAQHCLPVIRRATRPVLTCWMGGPAVKEAEALCASAAVPAYATPEEAVDAFLQVVRFRRNQQQLMEVPPSVPDSFKPDTRAAREIIEAALDSGQSWLTESDAKRLLVAYGIPVVETRVVRGTSELKQAARELGFPLALKILSPDILHKSDVGGVVLDIESEEALLTAAEQILARCRARQPQARIAGFTVQRMVQRRNAYELIAGVTVDPTFGPVILFGQGGTAVEVLADKAVALPPLNLALASELISRTRISKLLAGYRDQPAANRDAIALVLVQISQLIVDFAEVQELDVNPLLANEEGVIALDARVRVGPAAPGRTERLAIRPYPRELEERVEFMDREVLLRPIRPEDLPQHEAFLARVTAEDWQTRFFRAIRELPRPELAHLTQIDYERSMAFIAEARDDSGKPETLGVVRAHADPDNVVAEFSILVRSDLKGRGLGSILLKKLMRYCRERGIRQIVGDVMPTNIRMLRLAAECGFQAEHIPEGPVKLRADLSATTPEA